MPRRARLKIAGLPLHVMQRGNNKSVCFNTESDYRVYLALLGELGALCGCAVHAYVLMTNHVHLLLTPGRPENASSLMKHLDQRYAQYVNRKLKRTGTLWEGRFRSSLVDSEAYLLQCQRYIELNPVRARLVRHPAEYAWSSYRCNALGDSSPIVVPHTQYLALAGDAEARRARYKQLVSDGMSAEELEEIRAAAHGGFPLGRKDFLSDIETALGRPAVPRPPGRPKKNGVRP